MFFVVEMNISRNNVLLQDLFNNTYKVKHSMVDLDAVFSGVDANRYICSHACSKLYKESHRSK